MSLDDYRVIFVAVGLVGILLLSIPVLAVVVRLPVGETFSELYLLGSDNMAEDYPFNVTSGVNYLVNVDVNDHLGSSAYYLLYVKFRNETGPLPNDTSGVPSVLPSLYAYRMFLQDGGSGEFALNFSFSGTSFSASQATVGTVTVNGVSSSVDESSAWDTVNSGYYFQLFVELWLYSPASDSFSYNSRFVSLWLKLA